MVRSRPVSRETQTIGTGALQFSLRNLILMTMMMGLAIGTAIGNPAVYSNVFAASFLVLVFVQLAGVCFTISEPELRPIDSRVQESTFRFQHSLVCFGIRRVQFHCQWIFGLLVLFGSAFPS